MNFAARIPRIAVGVRIAALVALAIACQAADLALLEVVKQDHLVARLKAGSAVVVTLGAGDAAADDGKDKDKRKATRRALAYADLVAGTASLPADRGIMVVLICDPDGRAQLAAAITDLQGRGYANLRRFSAGMRGWRAIDQPADEKPRKPDRGD
jgi:hypothetical protein